MVNTFEGRRVGELAATAGLTVRTLHYYEEIKLLSASARTPAGHRLYSDKDVERLYRICLLRRLGLSLDEISRALDDTAWNLHGALTAHLSDLDRRIEAMGRLRARVSLLARSSGPGEGLLTDDLINIMEDMTLIDPALRRRIALLVYRDIGAALDYLVRVFGLGPGQLMREHDGRMIHGEIQAGDGVVWLQSEEAEFALSSPLTVGAATACMAVIVGDVDAHFQHSSEEGAQIEQEPIDQAFGYRQYTARDSEGHLWSFMEPLRS